MPIRSMTGFGLAEGETPSGTYRVEIRGVNNRFLEMQIRQPRFAANLEQKIKKEITSVVSRGSVTVLISCDREDEDTKLTYDKSSVENYVRIFREVKDVYELAGEVSLSDLLQFSDFIKTESVEHNDEELWKHLRPVLLKSIASFQQTREAEAAYMVKDLKKILDEIAQIVEKVETRAPQRIPEYADALNNRIDKMLSTSVEPQRIAAEVAIMADRIDISEECTRMRAHIKKFSEDFELNEPVGKRMGFLLQEMNREANTIGSKSNDTEISHYSVSLKENIEKIREQIQNIE
ncbi:YicC family protein [Chitinispirillales bacterium ANBcel5]|uniref:YicC/YloC family endoribonuclease n=1 Tax=Cellulosispirillum alkaliphilum TaxID=3039283 RepID=UPI002A56DEA6|nr:YicC family protein [Chitinispirillales bacterium ANBcel5]